MTDKKIIYYSDQNQGHCVSTKALLEDLGYAVQVYASGEEVMTAAAATPPDLLITSMGLSGEMDGLKFVRALRADAALKSLPIILHTGAHQVMHLPFTFAPDPEWFPVDAVVEKPARREFFKETIEAVLAAKSGAVA